MRQLIPIKDNTKPLIITAILFFVVSLGLCGSLIYKLAHNRAISENMNPGSYKVLKQGIDDRGLISVVYIAQRSDTLALDYLTKQEYDSLFNHVK